MMLDPVGGRKRGAVTRRAVAFVVVSWAGLAVASGCGTKPSAPPDPQGLAPAPISADELLGKLVRSDRQTNRYEDRATIELSYREGDRLVTDSADIAVSFVRPDRLSVKAYKATVYSDGRRFRAWIRDEDTNDLDGQMIDRPAPARLSLRELFSDPLLQDQMSNAVLHAEAGRTPMQLELLLADDDLELLADSTIGKRIGGEETVDGRRCHRLELTTPRGLFLMWIDSANYVLRKLVYPREALIPALANAEHVRDARLTAHFRDALLDAPDRTPQFSIDAPQGRRRVRYFIPPPQPLPSDLFGKTPGEFSFQPLAGEPVTGASLRGRTSVLLWFHEHPACEAALRQVEAVRRQVRGAAPGVAFYGVCTEPSTVDSAYIRAFVARWQVEAPIVRDLAAHGRDLFHFQGAPVLLVLNAEGVVQIVEVGANPNLEQELPVILERLAKGEDVAAEVLRQQQQERTRYERELAMAAEDEDPSGTSPTAGVIVPETGPRQLKRQPRWTLTDLRSPGNIVAIPAAAAGGAARIFVCEGPRSWAEISPAGELVARRELALPGGAGASNLRWRPEPSEKERIAAATLFQPNAFLLDKDRTLVATLPQPNSEQGIVDFGWFDMDGDGASELLLAFAGDRGIETYDSRGALRGKTAVGEPPASWVVAAPSSDRGGATRLWIGDAQGRPRSWDGASPPGKPIAVPGWSLRQVFAATFPAPAPSAFAALADNGQGRQALVAFDDQWKEQWNYPLSTPAARTPLEPVCSGLLFREDRPFWVLAAADGTVHFISADGAFSDFMSLGEPVTGLAIVRLDGDPLIITATAKRVAAWSLATP